MPTGTCVAPQRTANSDQRGHPHVLVLPQRHVPSLLEMTDEEVAAVAVEVRNAARLIEKAYGKSGIAVWQNNGVPAGQAIGHV
ncbi:MAG: HIT domain-containing protein, partial [Proteobacteria bacterium]